jgi:NitT/TauT family transport system substrate-binding protein
VNAYRVIVKDGRLRWSGVRFAPDMWAALRSAEAMVASDPALIRIMLGVHRRASEYMMANPREVADATVRILGAPRAAVEHALAAGNVEYIWRLDETVMNQSRIYGQHMQELRQIRQQPNWNTFLNPRFSNEVATS